MGGSGAGRARSFPTAEACGSLVLGVRALPAQLVSGGQACIGRASLGRSGRRLLTRQAGSNAPTLTALRTASCGFSSRIGAALRASPNLGRDLGHEVLDAHFPPISTTAASHLSGSNSISHLQLALFEPASACLGS
jgi:hypothetical protein